MSGESIKEIVKQKYGRAALRVVSGDGACCGPASSRGDCDPITSKLYEAGETAGLPAEAVAASLGCGNPTALAELSPGEIEAIPLPSDSVDVIISNCVINLSADKDRVFAEAFRVLKPGGRVAVSDVVVRGAVPPEIRKSVELWIGCVAGALEDGEYRAKLSKAGFEAIDLEPTRIYRTDDARDFLAGSGIDVDAIAPEVDGKFMSAFVRARKPTR